MNGMRWAKFRGKYFRRYNSKESQKAIFRKGTIEAKESFNDSTSENHNFSATEKQDFLLQNQCDKTNGSHLTVNMDTDNNMISSQFARPNDYVDYSKLSPESNSSNFSNSKTEERVSISIENNDIEKEDVSVEREDSLGEQVQDFSESVKKRKKRFKLGQSNKVHSSPPDSERTDLEIKDSHMETDKRLTF